jgi:carotenoid cleavage dioxygenase-like enzyme
VSERYAVVVQNPIFYNVRAMMLGQVSPRRARPAEMCAPAGCLLATLLGHARPASRAALPCPCASIQHAACHPSTQTSDFMVFDWKPELGTLLHVVPLHGGQVG